MPHLLIRGVDPDELKSVSGALAAELAGVCDCPPDHILIDCLHTTALADGAIVPSYPFAEVSWFDRGETVRDAAARCIDKHIRSLGLPELEIAFRTYERAGYYANGERLAAAEGEELKALRADNERLRNELHKARKAMQGQAMSSRLYDALRE